MFHKLAAIINSSLGASFVTDTSDEAYIITDGPEVYVFLWQRSPGDILWCWSSRPSAKQIEYINKRLSEDPGSYKLIESRDINLQPPNGRLGMGWLRRSNPEGAKELAYLWDTSEDISQQFGDKPHPSFIVIMKHDDGDGIIYAWKADKMTSKIQMGLKSYSRYEAFEVRITKSNDANLYKDLDGFVSLRYKGHQPSDYNLVSSLWDSAEPVMDHSAA
jgi:hypothetical protein